VTGLVRVEARRFRYRAAIRWLALLSVVAALAVVAGVVASVRPPSAEAVASAEQQVALAQEDWEENGDQYVADCLSGEDQERATNPDVDWGCDSLEPRLEQYVPVQPTFAEHAPGWLSGARRSGSRPHPYPPSAFRYPSKAARTPSGPRASSVSSSKRRRSRTRACAAMNSRAAETSMGMRPAWSAPTAPVL